MNRVSTYNLADGAPTRMSFVVPGTEDDVYRFAADLVDKAFKQGIPEKYVIEIAGKTPCAATAEEILGYRYLFGEGP